MDLVIDLLGLMRPALLFLLEHIEWLAWGSVLMAVLILVRNELSDAREAVEHAAQSARLRRARHPTAKVR